MVGKVKCEVQKSEIPGGGGVLKRNIFSTFKSAKINENEEPFRYKNMHYS